MSHPLPLRQRFQTLGEIRPLAAAAVAHCPKSSHLEAGLSELMINAIEHGNLGISYEEKSRLMRSGTWQEEVERRLALPENASRYAELSVVQEGGTTIITLTDQGRGFDWQPYVQFTPQRTVDPNGRGIALAMSSGFTSLEFQGTGNMVVCTIQPD